MLGLEFKIRAERIRELMQERDYDALLVYSNLLDREGVYWISNYELLGPRALVILPKDKDASLFISLGWDLERAKEKSWIKDVFVSTDFWRDCRIKLRDLGLRKSRIGFSGRELMYNSERESIERNLSDIDLEPTTDIIRKARWKKSEEEISNYRKVAEICDVAIEAFLSNVRAGITDTELKAEIEYSMRSKGAEEFGTLIGSGRKVNSLFPQTGRVIKEGDIVQTEVIPRWRGYYVGESHRAVIVGRPTKMQTELYSLIVRAYEESIKIIKPGTTVAEIAKKQNDVISIAGYWEYCHSPFMRVRGHGTDIGSITEDNMLELVPGMILTVHPNTYFPETGYLVVGDPFLVTEQGAERLTKTAYRLYRRPTQYEAQ